MVWKRTTANPYLQRMYEQAMPGMVIENLRSPSYLASVTPIPDDTVVPPSFNTAQIVIRPSEVTQNPELSSDPVKQLLPKNRRYVPETGSKTFLPNSAPPIPNTVAKAQVQAAAEGCAIARSAGRDPENIKKLFRKMWNLPDEFDPEIYAPVVNPEKSKPWRRYGATQNYEIHYAQNAQSLIHVTAGSYTSRTKSEEFEIDWDVVRSHLRIIATNVFLTEPGVIQDVLREGKEIRINYAVNHEEFPIAKTPLFEWNADKYEGGVQLPKEEIRLLMDDKPKVNYMSSSLMSQTIRAIPDEVIRELKDEREQSRGRLQLLDHIEANEELMSFKYGGGRSVNVTFPYKIKKGIVLREHMKHVLKSWMIQTQKYSPRLHKIYAYRKAGMDPSAAKEFMEIFDPNVLTFAYHLYFNQGRQDQPRAVFKEWLEIVYGLTTNFPSFDANNVYSTVIAAFNHGNYNFLSLVMDAYILCMNNQTRLCLSDFIDVRVASRTRDFSITSLKNNAYSHVSRYYKQKYLSEIEVLKLVENKSPDIKARLRMLQGRSMLYPIMNYSFKNQDVNALLFDSACRYAKKRKKLSREAGQIQSIDQTIFPRDYATKLDLLLGSNYVDYFDEAVRLSEMTKKDIDRLTWKPLNIDKLNNPRRMKRGQHTRKPRLLAEYELRIQERELSSVISGLDSGSDQISEEAKRKEEDWQVQKHSRMKSKGKFKFANGKKHWKNRKKKKDPDEKTDTELDNKDELNRHPEWQEDFNDATSPGTDTKTTAKADDPFDLLAAYDEEETFVDNTLSLQQWFEGGFRIGDLQSTMIVYQRHGMNYNRDTRRTLDHYSEIYEQYKDEIFEESKNERLREITDEATLLDSFDLLS
jgi:hypothetical protein